MIEYIARWLSDFYSLSANLMIVSDRSVVADDSYSVRFRLKDGRYPCFSGAGGANQA
jgi:hypothetical protein